MEPPPSTRRHPRRSWRFSSRRVPDLAWSIRARAGPHGAGVADGKAYPAYREEAGVKPESQTETFVALQAFVDNWRWAGVPFFLRTGKRLPTRASEIMIQLKEVPPILFNRDADHRLNANALRIRHQPEQGFRLHLVESAGAACR